MGIRALSTKEIIERGISLSGNVIEFTCDAVHCTKEERDVISAAVVRRQLELLLTPTSTADGDNYETALIMERHAVDTLLATRAKTEETTK